MIVPKTIDDLRRLIQDRVEESQELEYKAAQALQNSDGKEIGKDVSAMANASGGVVIYGIKEDPTNKHLPESITPILRDDFSKERLAQIINSNISPKIDGILIHPIPLEHHNQVVYVVEIPQSSTAHQTTKEFRYYRRYNFEVQPMQDYEIRDVMNRSKHPTIEMQFELLKRTYTAKSTPAFGSMPLHGIIQKNIDVVQTELILKLWPVNTGTQYAMYINYFVDLAKDIVAPTSLESLKVISDLTVQYQGENTFRDLLDVTHSPIGGATAKFGPSRFDPILPGLNGRSDTIQLRPDSFLPGEEIRWRVHADNAPARAGSIKMSEITFTQQHV